MDFETLSTFVSEDNVAGTNEEYNQLYLSMQGLAEGEEESVMGDSVISAKEPDYKKLSDVCIELWKSTRDLRVATYLTFANTQLYGLNGLYDGLRLIDFLVKNLWDDMYPLLDPEDEMDPTERFNILQILSPSDTGGGICLFLIKFRDIKLFSSLTYSYKDLLFAKGELENSENDLNLSLFEAECKNVSQDELAQKIALVNDILTVLDSIEKELYEKTQQAFYFTLLKDDLNFLLKFYSSLKPDENTNNDIDLNNDTNLKETKELVNTMNISDLSSYNPKNRQEALLLLQKSADYFSKHEPSNPIPFLLQRALRMADMNFVDLLKDIEPGYVDRIKDVLGIPKN